MFKMITPTLLASLELPTLEALSAIGVFLLAIFPPVWKGIVKPVVTLPFRMWKTIKSVEAEFAPNGGGSLRDAVDRMENVQRDQGSKLDSIQRQQQAMIETDSRALIEYDSLGRCTSVNRAWCELTGTQREDAIGFAWLQTVHPGERASIAKEWDMAVKQQRVFDARYQIMRKDGKEITVHHRATWVRDSAGPRSLFGTIDLVCHGKPTRVVD